MPRPVKVKKPSEHLLVLTRMLRQVEVDEGLPARSSARIRGKISGLIAEFQKMAAPPDHSPRA